MIFGCNTNTGWQKWYPTNVAMPVEEKHNSVGLKELEMGRTCTCFFENHKVTLSYLVKKPVLKVLMISPQP